MIRYCVYEHTWKPNLPLQRNMCTGIHRWNTGGVQAPYKRGCRQEPQHACHGEALAERLEAWRHHLDSVCDGVNEEDAEDDLECHQRHPCVAIVRVEFREIIVLVGGHDIHHLDDHETASEEDYHQTRGCPNDSRHLQARAHTPA